MGQLSSALASASLTSSTLVGVGFAVDVGDDGVSLVGILRAWAGDSDTEFDALAQLSAQCGDDRLAKVPFDLVLHKTGRNRKQSKSLGDDERLDQLQPGPLLRGQVGRRWFAVDRVAWRRCRRSARRARCSTRRRREGRGQRSMTGTPSSWSKGPPRERRRTVHIVIHSLWRDNRRRSVVYRRGRRGVWARHSGSVTLWARDLFGRPRFVVCSPSQCGNGIGRS